MKLSLVFKTTMGTEHTASPIFQSFIASLTRFLGAPEASRIYTYQDKTIRKVPLSSDVWSLGCVFSEALIWVGGGRGALEQAARDRRNEIQTYYQIMVGGSYGECFHNAQIALNCVVQSQNAAVEALEGPTNLSGSVCTLVLVGMLVPHEKRYPPSSLWHEFKSKHDYLFPIPGRAYSAPTHSRPQHLSPGVSSPVSTRRSAILLGFTHSDGVRDVDVVRL